MTDLRARYEDVAIRGLERTVPRDAPHYAANVEFVKQRFAEGLELVGYFASKYGERPLRILDLGAGAGGVVAWLAARRASIAGIRQYSTNWSTVPISFWVGVPATSMVQMYEQEAASGSAWGPSAGGHSGTFVPSLVRSCKVGRSAGVPAS